MSFLILSFLRQQGHRNLEEEFFKKNDEGRIISDIDSSCGGSGVVGLPERLTQAIEQKLEAEQESQRMEFVLLKDCHLPSLFQMKEGRIVPP